MPCTGRAQHFPPPPPPRANPLCTAAHAPRGSPKGRYILTGMHQLFARFFLVDMEWAASGWGVKQRDMTPLLLARAAALRLAWWAPAAHPVGPSALP